MRYLIFILFFIHPVQVLRLRGGGTSIALNLTTDAGVNLTTDADVQLTGGQ